MHRIQAQTQLYFSVAFSHNFMGGISTIDKRSFDRQSLLVSFDPLNHIHHITNTKPISFFQILLSHAQHIRSDIHINQAWCVLYNMDVCVFVLLLSISQNGCCLRLYYFPLTPFVERCGTKRRGEFCAMDVCVLNGCCLRMFVLFSSHSV